MPSSGPIKLYQQLFHQQIRPQSQSLLYTVTQFITDKAQKNQKQFLWQKYSRIP
jgi:hypothetical protein